MSVFRSLPSLFWALWLAPVLIAAAPPTSNQSLVAAYTTRPPTIDGVGNDLIWQRAQPIYSRDPISQVEVELKAAHDGRNLYLLARFPDATEDRSHMTLVWDPERELYQPSSDREDTLVVKWNMEPVPVDLTINGDDEYLADIWFWKADRSDPLGYADDKIQRYTLSRTERSTQRISKSGRSFYLLRDGDAGSSTYEVVIHNHFDGDRVPKYRHHLPSGSRADVRARGQWSGGVWIVEFARALDTGHRDDVAFQTDYTYEFGVSRHEIAGRDSVPDRPETLYGAGEIGPLMQLRFE